MPFVRLIAIYLVVGLAVFTVFNRDKVSDLLGWSGAEADETVVMSAAAPASAAVQPAPLTVDTTTATAPKSDPVYGSQDLQMPTAQEPAVQAEAPASDNLQQAWTQARDAYWTGDVDGAIRGYQTLIEAHPDEPGLAGELGNIYYAQRQMDKAAQYYHAAGKQLLAMGQPAQVGQLVGVLQGIAPDLAADLRNTAPATQN